MHDFITGIQQVGIGVTDAESAMHSYKKLFGMDILIFDDVADAKLMTQYTGDVLFKRRAILTLNMTGGGGFEIWQFLDRTPKPPKKQSNYGDLGIFAPKIKCLDIQNAFDFYDKQTDLSPRWSNDQVATNNNDGTSIWVRDKPGNQFQIVEAVDSFDKSSHVAGGVSGAVIGVSDMQASINFYGTLLGEYEIISDRKENYKSVTDNEAKNYHKVLLRKKVCNTGAFGKMLGGIDIELVQALDRRPNKIYENRYWGDLGCIHLCLDVVDMDGLKNLMQKSSYPFTVDSNDSYAMEASAGRFCYLEDPDGTLIELVETHKVPILKKFGLFFNLKKRGIRKPLPKWMIQMLALSKVKG